MNERPTKMKGLQETDQGVGWPSNSTTTFMCEYASPSSSSKGHNFTVSTHTKKSDIFVKDLLSKP